MENNENRTGTKLVEELDGMKFFIPSYQRGYRWTPNEVCALLDDLFEEQKKGTKYCLQPLIVKKDDQTGKFEVVDGQQRLTTIFIIYLYLKQFSNYLTFPFEIEYETREDSKDFLENLPVKTDEDAKKNIDYHYMRKAWLSVESWFSHRGQTQNIKGRLAGEMRDMLGGRTFFIWYEIADVDPIMLFEKENTGKIPLTSAELIKALLFSGDNVRKDESSVNGNNSAERIMQEQRQEIEWNSRQIQMATDWNYMERRLADDSFWYFLSNEQHMQTRIDLVFEVLAKKYNETLQPPISETQDFFSFLVFSRILEEDKTDKAAAVKEIWEGKEDREGKVGVLQCFAEFEDWYDVFWKYHLIGYLIAIEEDDQKGKTVFDIWSEIHDKKKSKAKDRLIQRIGESLKNIKGDKTLEKLDYGIHSHKKDIKKVLLLHNILTLLRTLRDPNSDPPHSGEYRFPFDKFKTRKVGENNIEQKWDIEHIHAIASKLPQKIEHIVGYFKSLVVHFEKQAEKGDAKAKDTVKRITKFNEDLDSREKDEENRRSQAIVFYTALLEEKIEELEPENGLGNLALLDSGTNRSYQDASFFEKKNKIVDREKMGEFIPLCTKNVFLKLYSDNPDHLHRWTRADQEKYLVNIQDTLKCYLPEGDSK